MKFLTILLLALAKSGMSYHQVSLGQLQSIMPQANKNTLESNLPYLNEAMQQYNIDTPARQSAFLGQVAEETGQLRTMTEGGNPSYFNKYDYRLGNNGPGQGDLYKGRGALQLTGKSNYEAASKSVGADLVNNPQLASTPQYAFKTAGWYWDQHNLNAQADKQNQAGFNQITKTINGCVDCPTTHNDQRTGYYNAAQKAFGSDDNTGDDNAGDDNTGSTGNTDNGTSNDNDNDDGYDGDDGDDYGNDDDDNYGDDGDDYGDYDDGDDNDYGNDDDDYGNDDDDYGNDDDDYGNDYGDDDDYGNDDDDYGNDDDDYGGDYDDDDYGGGDYDDDDYDA
jgi:predicted chitinase